MGDVIDEPTRASDQTAHREQAVVVLGVVLRQRDRDHPAHRCADQEGPPRAPQPVGEELFDSLRLPDAVLDRQAVLRKARVRDAEAHSQELVAEIVDRRKMNGFARSGVAVRVEHESAVPAVGTVQRKLRAGARAPDDLGGVARP